MKSKYTKRQREEAADILAVMASSDAMAHPMDAMSAVGASDRSLQLAVEATYATPSCLGWREDYAEAEAMLRTGWTP